MRKSYNIVAKYRGRGIREKFVEASVNMVEIQTDDSSFGLAYQLPVSRSTKHIRIAACTNPTRHEWTVYDVFKKRIKQRIAG